MSAVYPIPEAGLDDRLAFVGTSGSGKTYAAGTAVEKILARRGRVVIVDPLGVWWGLRLAPDGRSGTPWPIIIFGGARGDLPLNEAAGRTIGETVATMRESAIVDLSGFGTKSSERRFMLAFLEALYRAAPGEPFHLVIDEADLFAPQKASEPQLQSLMEQIVRRGRVKGFKRRVENEPKTKASPDLTGPQAALLRALAWWNEMGHEQPTRTQLAAKAGWKPKGSNLRNRLSELSGKGLVSYPGEGRVSLTDAGNQIAPAPDLAVTLIDSIRAILTGPQGMLFEALLAAGGPLGRADLAARVGWEPGGSNLRNRLSEMSAMEIVEYPATGQVALQPWVVA